MGTLARIVAYAPDATAAARAIGAAFRRIRDLESIFSDYQTDSELSRLCEQGGQGYIPVSADLFRILDQSQQLAVASGGAFDVSAGPVIRLWRRARRQRQLPDDARLMQSRALTGYAYLQLNPENQTTRLSKEGMRLDLGGIAKGYAADEAIQSLKESGISAALVALGGDVAVSDRPPGKLGWTVEIATPGLKNAPRLSPLLLCSSGVSTSGDAEQYVEIDGVRHSHIVDPRTGKALTGQRSVTVVAPTATLSDGLATAVCVMGPESGLALLDSMSGTAGLMIIGTGAEVKVWRSKRWKD
jgi:thiamine biosynthesis lipoprotein